jgi:hypothetical protein
MEFLNFHRSKAKVAPFRLAPGTAKASTAGTLGAMHKQLLKQRNNLDNFENVT